MYLHKVLRVTGIRSLCLKKNGYVHSDYLELIEKRRNEQNSEMDMALLMMFMIRVHDDADSSVDEDDNEPV